MDQQETRTVPAGENIRPAQSAPAPAAFSDEERAKISEMASAAMQFALNRQRAWEQDAGEDLSLAREIRKIFAGEDAQTILERIARQQEPPRLKQAQEQSADERQLTQIRDELLAQKRARDERVAFARDLARQEAEIRLESEQFDLEQAMASSPAFRALVLSGEPVSRALDYIEPERRDQRVERALTERIRRRGLRPEGIGQANRPSVQAEDAQMSEEQLRAIDARLKRGEKVYI